MSIPRRSAALVFVLVFTLLAAAPLARALGPKCDVFLGYSRLLSNAFYSNVGGLNGWEGSLHCKAKPFLGWEGNVSQYGVGENDTVPRTTAVLGGGRVTVGTLGVHVWGHALGGIEHSSNSAGASISDSKFAYALGAGADVRFFPFLSWRLSGDYLNATSTPSGGNHARLSTGLVFRF